MKKTMTRFLAILCTLAMVFSMAPASMTVYAASEDANVEAAADGAEEQKEEEVVVEEKEEKVVEKKEEPAKEEKKEVSPGKHLPTVYEQQADASRLFP